MISGIASSFIVVFRQVFETLCLQWNEDIGIESLLAREAKATNMSIFEPLLDAIRLS